MRRRRVRLLAASVLALAVAAHASAAPAVGVSRFESHLSGRSVPDIALRLADGRSMRLSELAAGKPLLVTFFYRRCTGVCVPLLEWVRESARGVGGLGTDYRVLALSFDDADTVADVRAQAAALGLLETAGWSFAIAERDAVARIAGALDFWYQPDPVTRQYDHPALVVALDGGRVVDALLVSPGGSQRLRGMVSALRGTFIPTYPLPQQTPLRCLSFDPVTGAMRMDWGMLLLVFPALAAAAAVSLLFVPAARRRRQFC
ncbi:MAG: SCO family protein [Gammaproteobacteria bacterium]|nr:MAG: SCO family protein [Gammaproteobacteria bacterium]